jgi:hypothetical protein
MPDDAADERHELHRRRVLSCPLDCGMVTVHCIGGFWYGPESVDAVPRRCPATVPTNGAPCDTCVVPDSPCD